MTPKKMQIKKAILPVAGLGTRFLPATKAQPKEMLPVFDTPAIQFIVEEAVEAGIDEIIIITGRGKHAIENHFDGNFELEHTLEKRGKLDKLKLVRRLSDLATFVYVRQSEPLGDGHAILQAADLIHDDESVVVLFGDDIVDNPGGKNAVQQLLDVHQQTGDPVILLEAVAKEDTDKYGIVEMTDDRVIQTIVEKPKPADAPSNLGVVGKFVLTPNILQALRTTQPGPDGEIRLTNAFKDVLASGGQLRGKILEGTRFDTGDKLGFLRATLHYALKQEDGAVMDVLKQVIERGEK